MRLDMQGGRLWLFAVLFGGAWISYGVVVAVYTHFYEMENFALIISFYAAFLLLVLIPCTAIASIAVPSRLRVNTNTSLAIIFALGFSTLGVLCFAVDKLAIQQVDYSLGVCYAREEMTRLGTVRGGSASSIFSVIGHLFSSSYLVALGVAFGLSERRRDILIAGFASLALMIIYVYLAASRTPVLMYFVFVFAFLTIRIWLGKTWKPFRLYDLLFLLGGMLLGAFVILSGFQCRAEASRQTAAEYTQDFAAFLDMEPVDESGRDGLSSSAPEEGAPSAPGGSPLFRYVSMVGLYASHGAYTFSQVIEVDERQSSATLAIVEDMAFRAGLLSSKPEPWTFAGRFIAVPGAFFHDFGLAGFVILSGLTGLMIGASLLLLRAFPGILTVGLGGSVIMIAYLSPVLLAWNIATFPFVVFDFLLVAIVISLRQQARGRAQVALNGSS